MPMSLFSVVNLSIKSSISLFFSAFPHKLSCSRFFVTKAAIFFSSSSCSVSNSPIFDFISSGLISSTLSSISKGRSHSKQIRICSSTPSSSNFLSFLISTLISALLSLNSSIISSKYSRFWLRFFATGVHTIFQSRPIDLEMDV